MTQDDTARQDARDLQARLYREIGISAVAAALRFTTQPDPAPRADARLDGSTAKTPVQPPAQPAARAA